MTNEEFAEVLRLLLERWDHASMAWKLVPTGVSAVEVDGPRNRRACPFSVGWSAHEIVIGFGGDNRIELGPPDEDVDVAIGIVTGILSGRVSRSGDGRRADYFVELDDGTSYGTRTNHRPPGPGSVHTYEAY